MTKIQLRELLSAAITQARPGFSYVHKTKGTHAYVTGIALDASGDQPTAVVCYHCSDIPWTRPVAEFAEKYRPATDADFTQPYRRGL
jgi:hypothetical protein